jgi:hypothetical protein
LGSSCPAGIETALLRPQRQGGAGKVFLHILSASFMPDFIAVLSLKRNFQREFLPERFNGKLFGLREALDTL